LKQDEYYHGRKGRKYGIWNSARKCFQFGICEDTPQRAVHQLFEKIGKDAYKWCFAGERGDADDGAVWPVQILPAVQYGWKALYRVSGVTEKVRWRHGLCENGRHFEARNGGNGYG